VRFLRLYFLLWVCKLSVSEAIQPTKVLIWRHAYVLTVWPCKLQAGTSDSAFGCLCCESINLAQLLLITLSSVDQFKIHSSHYSAGKCKVRYLCHGNMALYKFFLYYYIKQRRSMVAVRIMQCHMGGSVAEWLACWTQMQKGLGSNLSRDAVG